MKKKLGKRSLGSKAACVRSEAYLAMVGRRFQDLRAAKRFARENLEAGRAPREIVLRARQACRESYAPLPKADRQVMTDLIMSAVSNAIAEWLATPNSALTGLNAWIEMTIAKNRGQVMVNGRRR